MLKQLFFSPHTVSPPTSDLKDGFSGIITNVTITAVHFILPPSERGREEQDKPYSSVLDPNSKLRWEEWNNNLPNGAVVSHFTYKNIGFEYVCKYNCYSGFYKPSKGPYCYYSLNEKEYRATSFEILVNEDGFEKLEWKDGNYGSVPDHAVISCSSDPEYVGRNEYGLGRVYPKNTCFYLPYEGYEYWYKYYEVLTVNTDADSETISDVKYNIGQAEMITNPPYVMETYTVSNAECKPVKETVAFTTKSSETSTWDMNFSQMIRATISFTAGIPFVRNSKIEISSETTFQYSKGQHVTEEISKTVSFDPTVPPQHSCDVNVLGFKYNSKIPFTALLTRTYKTGETRSTTISGTYDGVQSGKVEIKINRCEPLPDTKPCA